mgnify:CR=1 FL=1|jgi:23S rRNA pseudouridine2604 synthase
MLTKQPIFQAMRINRFIASSGLCSRRQADRLIREGRVLVNGMPASTGMMIETGDRVTVDGRPLEPPSPQPGVVLAFHKPKGITSTSDPARRDNIIDFIGYPRRIFTVGRLDRDSRGLILLTDDGGLAHRIMHSRFGHEKEYVVTVDRKVSQDFLQTIKTGVPILGRTTLPCSAWMTGEYEFHIVLRQGLNRQIRRMCEVLGYRVTDLIRTRIMHITLGSLPEGSYRELTFKEKEELVRATSKESGR